MKKLAVKNGAVSMLSVIFLSIFLTLITTSFVRLMVSEQREATNADLSMRAYYAAQSGFEDAMRLVSSGKIATSNTNDCEPMDPTSLTRVSSVNVASTDSGIDASYTCEMVSLNPNQLSYGDSGSPVQANDAILFPINVTPIPSSNNYTVSINWTPGNNPRVATGKSLPPVGYWLDPAGDGSNNGAPAMMRANIVWTPDGSLSNLKSQAFYLNPSNGTDPSSKNPIDTPPPAVDLSGTGGLPSEPIINVQCTGGSCTGNITLNNVSGSTIFLVTRPIYQSASTITVTASSDGTNLNFSTGQATIDITGKAGNTYRRIKQAVPYGKFKVGQVSDFALVAGDGICKNMSVGVSASSFSPNSCP